MELPVPYLTFSSAGFIHQSVLLLLLMTEITYCFNQSLLYETKPCTLLNTTVKIPCIQHVFIHKSSRCKTEELQKLFPHLYTKPRTNLKIPGPVRLLEPHHSNFSWRTSNDGSVYFLKGFQVIQTGSEMINFQTQQCAVIDISNITEDQSTKLPDIIFSVDFKRPGSYIAEVQSLPLGNSDHADTIQLTQDPMYEEYHPQLTVTLNHKQVNQTCVNVSLTVHPPVQNVDQIKKDIFYNGTYIQNLSTPVPYKDSQNLLICSLKIGNYSVKISLIDKYAFEDGQKCVCFKGTPTVFTCQPCKVYTRTFNIVEYNQPIRQKDGFVPVILGVTCPILFVTAVTGLLYLLYKRHYNELPFFRRKTRSDKSGYKRVPHVCMIYSHDHDAHIKAVKTFIQMIEISVGCSVTCLDTSNKETSTESISLAGSKPCDLLDNCDVIIVVHSEYMNFLIRELTNIQKHVTKAHAENLCITKSFLIIKSNPILCQKTISVYFDYTDKSSVTLLGSECLFFLPLQISNLRQHILNKTNLKQKKKSTAALEQVKDVERLVFSAVKSSYFYQKQHPNWLSVKLFHMQPSCSCDDSGIMVTNQCMGGHRNMRSRSVDTVCKCNRCQPLSECPNCNKGRPRRHSFDFSFSPPDTISLEESVRMSLLESKMVALNNCYNFVLNNNSNPEEEEYDYLTIYGNSV